MSMQIHWHEGLFLQPHHLQRMQRSQDEQVAGERRLGWPYPYGLIEARLSRDELENMRVRFEKLRAIMPSGLEVNYPGQAELPSLDIKQAFTKGSGTFQLLLGVPLWQDARANAVRDAQQTDSRVKVLYRVSETECVDENTGENLQPIQVRKINARLMFDQDDTADLEVLPLLRIKRAAGDDAGLPQEDPEYVPPCLVLSGSPTLRERARDLVNAVEAQRKALVVLLTRGGFSMETIRGLQIRQLLKLRTLNRYSGRLPALVLAPNMTPFTLYLELRELLGELAALKPEQDEFECRPYDHENAYLWFADLNAKIRKLLPEEGGELVFKVDFRSVNNVLTAVLEDKHLTAPNAYFLGIKTKLDPTVLARYVEDGDKFKLMPQSLALRAIRGIELKEERHPPLELPAASDLHYFRLDRAASARMWEQVRLEKAAIVRWIGSELDWSDAHFTLYMTVPSAPAPS